MPSLRTFAETVLLSPAIDAKLRRVDGLFADDEPGPPLRVERPARPDDLQFAPRRTAPAMPHPNTFSDPARRAVAHHILANHELQALEVMAATLLAFPDAPTAFRQGMARIMTDEQRHTRMHIERAAALGVRFGDLPVNGYIWQKSREFVSVLDYLAGLPLTFEGRNLDHTLEFERHFQAAGDPKSAAVMRQIHRDEIEHVAFGYEWLCRLKPAALSDWDAYVQHLHWPLRPDKARGDEFHSEPRTAAGLSAEFIDRLRAS
uniref:DUF455 family protein n=1 Tax=Schlesneria paludicola TaxID=360056 RepID=A0A7C2PI20_9PLAN